MFRLLSHRALTLSWLLVMSLNASGCYYYGPEKSRPVPVTVSYSTPVTRETPSVSGSPAFSGFEKSLSLLGHEFKVRSANESDQGTVSISWKQSGRDKKVITAKFHGMVLDAEVADLDQNGDPEVYIYTFSGDDQRISPAGLLAYAASKSGSLSKISVTPVSQIAEAREGFRGNDQFRIDRGHLVQTFPIYLDGSTTRRLPNEARIDWKLVPAQGDLKLVVDKVTR